MHLFLPEVVSQALEPYASVPSLLLSQSSESPCQTTTETMISMLLLLWLLPALSKFKTQRNFCNGEAASTIVLGGGCALCSCNTCSMGCQSRFCLQAIQHWSAGELHRAAKNAMVRLGGSWGADRDLQAARWLRLGVGCWGLWQGSSIAITLFVICWYCLCLRCS